MCLAASSRLVKRPVDSNTTSTPRSFHGNCAGSLMERTWKSSLFTVIRSPLAEMSAFKLPRIESYFSRCASVSAFVRSLTATKSKFASPIAARMMLRPMRPNPLIPTLIAISEFLQTPQTADFNERLARWSNRGYIQRLAHVRGLQRLHRPVLHCDVALPGLPGGAVPQIRDELAATPRHSAGFFQPRCRRINLDPRGVGRGSPDRACAAAGAARTVSAPSHLPVHHHHHRTPGGAQQPPVRGRCLLFPVRLPLHRRTDAAPGEAAPVHHDGNRAVA